MRLIFVIAIFLSACTRSSGVIPLSDDTFLISRSEKGFDTTGSRVKADAIKEANSHCETLDKRAEVIKASGQDMKPFRSDAQAEIEFRCVATK